MIPAKLQSFLETVRGLNDQDLRFEYLIELAGRFQAVPPSVAVRPFAENHKVPGCESDVYIWAVPAPEGGKKFFFAVENPQGISAKAMAVVLDETLSGAAPEQISKVSPEFVYELFGRTVSMGKGQGMMNMVNAVKALAKAQ